MKKMDRLTEDIIKWQKDGTGFESILEQISSIVIRYPKKTYGWSEDECAEFYCFFYNRMIRLARDFKYRDQSFKALLNNSMKWQMRTFHRKYRNDERRNYCVRYDSMLTAEVACEPEPVFELFLSDRLGKVFELDDRGRIKDYVTRKRIIMLLLKNSPFVNDNYADAVARLTSCDRKWLDDALLHLREGIREKRKRLEVFSAASNRTFIEICALHREFSSCDSADERELILNKLEQLKKRLARACRNKATVKLMPSNSEIAEVMKIPKGSIDSGLFYLKKYLTEFSEQDKIPD